METAQKTHQKPFKTRKIMPYANLQLVFTEDLPLPIYKIACKGCRFWLTYCFGIS